MRPLETVHEALRTRGHTITRDGRSAQCPAHEDRNPSLSITAKDDGTVLLHCHAGCPLNAVLHELGLTQADLFPPRPTDTPAPFRPRRIVAEYDYTDEDGALLFQVVRYDPKSFRQRHKDADGTWVWNLNGTRRVPYRLPQLLTALAAGDTVYIVEGEKDVQAIEAAGGTATCNPGGAGKWDPAWNTWFHGAHVVVVADNDPAGHQHAHHIAAQLASHAATLTVVTATTGKDATDHLAAGHTLHDWQTLDLEPDPLPQPIDWATFWTDTETGEDWLIEPLIPARRALALIAQYKTGKSLLALHIAYALATGQAIFDRPAQAPIHVTYIDYEMSRDDLLDRLESLGATDATDLSHLHYYQGAFGPPLDTPEGGQLLIATIQRDQSTFAIIDTHGRSVEGEEASADTMRAFARHTGGPLKEAGVTWVRLDHVGHTNRTRARGSAAKGEDVDVMWVLEETDTLGTFQLTSTSRIPWLPRQLTLTRGDEAGILTHQLANHDVPASVLDCVRDLERLDVPIEASRREAEQTLRQAGCGRRTTVILEALKYRKTWCPDARNHPETPITPEPPRNPGTTGHKRRPDVGTSQEPETVGKRDSGVPSLEGTTGSHAGPHNHPNRPPGAATI